MEHVKPNWLISTNVHVLVWENWLLALSMIVRQHVKILKKITSSWCITDCWPVFQIRQSLLPCNTHLIMILNTSTWILAEQRMKKLVKQSLMVLTLFVSYLIHKHIACRCRFTFLACHKSTNEQKNYKFTGSNLERDVSTTWHTVTLIELLTNIYKMECNKNIFC